MVLLHQMESLPASKLTSLAAGNSINPRRSSLTSKARQLDSFARPAASFQPSHPHTSLDKALRARSAV